jgi:glycosyltransferase involved in cell wall biosynthesis
VASVLGQTYRNLEIIIVNDGSPDGTSEVARGLATQSPDKRISLVEQPNMGLAQARNAGIKAGSGRYVLPLDADDKIAPAMLEKTVSCLEADPAIAIVYTDALYFGSQNYEQPTMEYDFATLCYQNHLNYCSLFRRDAWERVGGYNPNMVWGYEDWDFWIGCGEAGFFARHLAEPLLHYRVKGESMFTRALSHDLELRAQIILNHPRLYNEASQSWAREILKSAGGVTADGARPHDILRREHLLTELQGLKAEYKKSNAKWQELQVQWQARHAELYASEVECQARYTRLKEAHERCQSALAYATEGGPPPAWMRRIFEKTLSQKFRSSIRKRLTSLRGAFENPTSTASK